MTVKDVIKETARLVGDEDLYAALEGTTGAASDETTEKTQIMLKCYNDTLFEIATGVLPIEAEEEIELGVVKFSSLAAFPQKINKIRKDGYSVKFHVGVNYFETEEKGTGIVTYEKMPTEKPSTTFSSMTKRLSAKLFSATARLPSIALFRADFRRLQTGRAGTETPFPRCCRKEADTEI